MARLIGADLQIIEIHDAVLFAPGGDVNEWCRGIARDLKRRARLYAPPNHSTSRYQRTSTGRMLSTIDSGVFEMTDDTLMIELSVGTDYAQYVLGGTAAQGTQYIY